MGSIKRALQLQQNIYDEVVDFDGVAHRGLIHNAFFTRGFATLRTLAMPAHRATLCLCEARLYRIFDAFEVSAAPMVCEPAGTHLNHLYQLLHKL